MHTHGAEKDSHQALARLARLGKGAGRALGLRLGLGLVHSLAIESTSASLSSTRACNMKQVWHIASAMRIVTTSNNYNYNNKQRPK